MMAIYTKIVLVLLELLCSLFASFSCVTVFTFTGNNATLPCSSNTQYPQWKGPSGNGNIIFNYAGNANFANPALGEKQTRLSWGQNLRDLIIKNTIRGDKGNYTCVGTGSVDSTELIVIVPPQTPAISNIVKLENNLEVVYGNEGQPLTITCTSRGGYPAPTVVWYKNSISTSNQMASTGTGTLQGDDTYTVTLQHTFTPTVSDDSLSLICRSYYPQADSGDKSSKTKSVLLYLKTTISSFYIEHEGERSETVSEHDVNVRITCEVDSNPRSTIKIMFGGEKLTEETNVKLLSFTRNDVTCLQAGAYTCEAFDGYWQPTESNVTLFVKCSPRPLKQMKQNITASLYAPRTLSFTTLAYPEPGPSGFFWHKETGARWTPVLGNTDIQILSSGLQSNLTILNVSQSDYGQYRVTANNSMGSYEQYLYLKQNGRNDMCTCDNIMQTDTTINSNKQTETTTNSNIHTDNTGNNNTKTALIVGVTLGVFSAAVVVYAIYVTILLKRKNTDRGPGHLNKSTNQVTYVNQGFRPNITDIQNRESKNAGVLRDEEDSDADKQYTSLDKGTKDNTVYDVIQKS